LAGATFFVAGDVVAAPVPFAAFALEAEVAAVLPAAFLWLCFLCFTGVVAPAGTVWACVAGVVVLAGGAPANALKLNAAAPINTNNLLKVISIS
jgi:hypothetical protein